MERTNFESVMALLAGGDTLDMCGERLQFTIWRIDSYAKDLTPEQEEIIKKRLIECRENFLAGQWDWIVDQRKTEKIPRSRFWWYVDEL